MYRLTALLFLLALLGSCGSEASDPTGPSSPSQLHEMDSPKPDMYRGLLDLGEEELPFNFTAQHGPNGELLSLEIHNATERILLRDLEMDADTATVHFPIFESALRFHIGDAAWQGYFQNDARSSMKRIPFSAEKGEARRFVLEDEGETADVNGKWEVEFIYEDTEKSTALGIFKQEGNHLEGTFQTPTGDYRFLEGEVQGNTMHLSCFDGAHAFLFRAEKQADGSLSGGFWSGRHWYESWTATLAHDFELPDPNTLTQLKPGYKTLDFSFPNPENNTISPTDSSYYGKVLIVQIMGTWCPNCKDETAYLQELYSKYHERGLEIIAIGFETTPDMTRGLENLSRMRSHFDISYEVVYGGKAGKKTAGEALPALEHVMSYPTTIFMDRNHKVHRIYTGFSGPAVKGAYEKLTASFEETVQELVTREPPKAPWKAR